MVEVTKVKVQFPFSNQVFPDECSWGDSLYLTESFANTTLLLSGTFMALKSVISAWMLVSYQTEKENKAFIIFHVTPLKFKQLSRDKEGLQLTCSPLCKSFTVNLDFTLKKMKYGGWYFRTVLRHESSLPVCYCHLSQRQQTHLSGADSPQPDTVLLQSSAQLSVVRFFWSLSLSLFLPRSQLCANSAWQWYTSAQSSL